MGSELKRLMLGAAGALGSRVAQTARTFTRRAHEHAGRIWRDVGERLRLEASAAGAALEQHRRLDPPGTAENAVLGARTRALVETMAEVLERSGYRELHADIAGRPLPDVVRGTVRSHRPSLVALGGGRAVFVDVFVPAETTPEEQLSRWHLFSSAAQQLDGEFHVVVPATVDGIAGRAWATRLADSAGLSIRKVWEI